jgi:hypothetical protein
MGAATLRSPASAADSLAPLGTAIAAACDDLRRLLRSVLTTGLGRAAYARYLSFQHHLTRGVQQHFFAVAAHASLADRRPLREFLFRFGLEEEPHFRVAAADLRALGAEPLPPPVEVDLWWSYFDRVVVARPFVRLGATAVLENLGPGTAEESRQLLQNAPFLTAETTRFLVIHRHEALPHGDQILDALAAAAPTAEEMADLLRGAEVATKLYLGMMRWALLGER